jgi:hypothetical protein
MVTLSKLLIKRAWCARDLAKLWEFGVWLHPRHVAHLCHMGGWEIRPTTPTTPTCSAHFLFTLPFGAMLGPSCVVACARNTTLEIVWVHGRYRVGKPLGSGTFDTFVLRSRRTRYSDLYRECLLRKRHQDWVRRSFETRGYSRLEFKSCARIQCLSGSFRTLRDPQGVLVWEGRTISCHCPRLP